MEKNSLIEETLCSTYEGCMSLDCDLNPEGAEEYKQYGDDDLLSAMWVIKSFGGEGVGAGLVAEHEELVGVESGVGGVGFGSNLGTIFI